MYRFPATLVTWLFAPEWLTVEEAAQLTGRDPETIQELVARGCLDTKEIAGAIRIEKHSLRECHETLFEVAPNV